MDGYFLNKTVSRLRIMTAAVQG